MPVLVLFLKAVNVGGHNKIKMEELRAICEKLGCTDVKTYVQSGNAVCKVSSRDAATLPAKISGAIEKKLGFRPEVISRTTQELREVLSNNPFAKRKEVIPGKLVVFFLAGSPGKDANKRLAAVRKESEELHLIGRELFAYFPEGQGQSKLTGTSIEKALEAACTGRNWNTVTKMLAMAEELEQS